MPVSSWEEILGQSARIGAEITMQQRATSLCGRIASLEAEGGMIRLGVEQLRQLRGAESPDNFGLTALAITIDPVKAPLDVNGAGEYWFRLPVLGYCRISPLPPTTD